MSNLCHDPKILSKARPLPEQIADRLASPGFDGIEFYMDCSDLAGDRWLDRLQAMLTECPDGLEYVVEGPLRSLDGAFFDTTVPNEANLEVLERLVEFGRRIGARAAVIHAMAPRREAGDFDDVLHAEALEKALELFRYYSDLCNLAGLVPTVENVPPVARMRENRFMYSLIGTAPADVLYLTHNVPNLRVTIDVSHAQLYVNAHAANREKFPAELLCMLDFIQSQPRVSSLDEYIDLVSGQVFEAHLSNAKGLLGEGLPYGEGELDMDRVVRRLNGCANFLVTETIEPDPNCALLMRDALRRIATALGRPDLKG